MGTTMRGLELLGRLLWVTFCLFLPVPPTLFVSALHREGATPVPVEIIRQARALNARYRHVAAQHRQRRRLQKTTGMSPNGTHPIIPRQRRIRGLQQEQQQQAESFLFDALEDHLFVPRQPEDDNEQQIIRSDGTPIPPGETTANTVSLRQVALEGSAKPLFFCSQCRKESPEEIEECAQCTQQIHDQQAHIISAVNALFPKAKIVTTTSKLMNTVFVEMAIAPHDDIAEIDHALSRIPGVLKIMAQEDSTLDDTAATEYMGGGEPLAARFCGVGGSGIKIAVLDSGIDYTHERIGGPGTREAYQLAYGTGPDSPENKKRNADLFPTERVIGGKDFLGESFEHTAESLASDAEPDDNPIDANRHGTMVADAILSVAPKAQLLACKVCTSDTGTCPGFAVLQALEYALDPNEDGNTDDKVDIVNLSLGGAYLSSYYDLRTQAMEAVFSLGVLPVLAAGNEGNIPYIGGPGAKTPNALAVASTVSWDSELHSKVATYSSRGPGDSNDLKPDIAAPSGLTLAAFGTGNEFLDSVQGTSFSAPLAAGAIALIKERCPACSPFALKAILMNNAKRHVQYNTANMPLAQDQTIVASKNATQVEGNKPIDDAPNSLVGAGEIQLTKTLDSDVWAYSVEDIQPSISFGLINAHKEMVLKKTIKVINLSGLEQNLKIRNEVSSKLLKEDQVNPTVITFSPDEQILPAECNAEITFEVTLTVDATKAPENRMSSGGRASNDPTLNDWNEFGGWIVIANIETTKDISLPYHALIRRASDLKIEGTSVIDNFNGGPTTVEVGLANHGAGVAQIDAFELLFTSEDDAEGGYGEEITPSDFRYVGYRVLEPEGQAGTCDYLLEFSFTTWEKQQRINLEFFQIHVDTNLDGSIDYILFNSGVFTPFTDNVDCVVRNTNTGEIKCTGMPPDHSTNTGNTILRVCSNDLGFVDPPETQQQINVYILTATATHLGVTEVTDRASEQFHTLEFPQTWISAPSYDIYPGETLDVIEVDGSGGNSIAKPLGLMLVSNSYRGPLKTGAATAETETLILTNGQQDLPVEVTPDELVFPVAEDFEGPDVCAAWEETGDCANVRSGISSADELLTLDTKHLFARQHVTMRRDESNEYVLTDEGGDDMETRGSLEALLDESRQGDGGKCPEIEVPRSRVLRVPGSQISTTAPTGTSAPANNFTSTNELGGDTLSPTIPPTTTSPTAPPVVVTLAPSLSPIVSTQLPSRLPTTPAPVAAQIPVTNSSKPGVAVVVASAQETLESATFFTSSSPFTPVTYALGWGAVCLSTLAYVDWVV